MRLLKVTSLLPIRLDKYLMQEFPRLGIGLLNKSLRENKIKLNGKKQPLSTRVQNGDEIKLFIPDLQLGLVPANSPAFLQANYPAKIIYEDDFLLLADKPAGLPVSDEAQADTLINRVLLYLYNEKKYIPEQDWTPQLCHRLDTGTSGLVIIAKDPEALTLISKLIKNRSIKKEYLCVTFGRPLPPSDTLNGFLAKDSHKGHVQIFNTEVPGSKPVITRYETVATSGRLALLKVQLITGRTHQIRAHLASIGCPILGDSKYGNNTANREFRFKYQALCAWKLSFPKLSDQKLSGISEKAFQLEQPWYCHQVIEKSIK